MNTSNYTNWSSVVDSSFKPNDNFFLYVNNKWIKNNPIPDDMSRWGMFNILDESNKKKIKDILTDEKLNSNIKILHQGYSKKTGLSFFQKLLEHVYNINNIDQYKQVLNLLSSYQLVNAPIDFYVYANLNDSENNILYVSDGGLHLPDRDYYLKDDMKDKLEKYQQFMINYITSVLNNGIKLPLMNTDKLIEFEKMLASWAYSKVKKRNPKYYNNPTTYEDFKKIFPNVRIDDYLELKTNKVNENFNMNITNPHFIKNWNQFLCNENIDILKAHLCWSLILKLPLVSKKFEDLKFDFYGKGLSGLKEMKPLWKRSIDYVNSQLGELLGLEFCKKYFTDKSKNKCLKMVNYIIEELGNRLSDNDWMDNDTKTKALEKLSKIRVKIGYPNVEGRRDFSELKLDSSKTFLENHCMMNKFDTVFNVNELNTKKNKERFHMYPHMVNAYYSPVNNEIVFPAGILQQPFFDGNKEMAENFGAIGAVIGHEITHGFDDQGRKYDGNGNLNEWWSENVLTKYQEKTNKIKDLFSTFDINGKNVNGDLTLGENIADLGGLSISYQAYLKYLKDFPNENRIVDGFTAKQRFFLSFGRIWCSHMRDEESMVRLTTDPHSPPKFRVNGTLMNMKEFYDIFHVTDKNNLYLVSDKRGSVW